MSKIRGKGGSPDDAGRHFPIFESAWGTLEFVGGLLGLGLLGAEIEE